jgi:hypothetical protein
MHSTLWVCSTNWSNCKKLSSVGPRVAPLLFRTHPMCPFAFLLWNDVQGERFKPRGVYPIQQQASTPCIANRRGENASWAGDAPTKTLLKENGSRSPAFLVAHPERSSGDMFRELQRLSPGRYQPLQIRTLQRGMRKIRSHLLETFEDQWGAEVIHGQAPVPDLPAGRATSIF